MDTIRIQINIAYTKEINKMTDCKECGSEFESKNKNEKTCDDCEIEAYNLG